MEDITFEFYDFLWSACVILLFLFSIVSFSLYRKIRDKTFSYYGAYCLVLLIYLSLKQPLVLDSVWFSFLSFNKHPILLSNFNWYVQVVFYSFYVLYGIGFIELEKFYSQSVSITRKLVYAHLIIATTLFICATLMHNQSWFYYFYLFWFVPFLIFLLLYLIPKAMVTPMKMRHIFVTGVCLYATGAILSLWFSIAKSPYLPVQPLLFFLAGILLEILCLGLGMTKKYQQVYDDRFIKQQELLRLSHNQEIMALKNLMEGEQNERKRMSTELHDGLANLFATISLHLEATSMNHTDILNEDKNFHKAMELLEHASEEIRQIAHRMMPKTVIKLSLVPSIEELIAESMNIHFHFTTKEKDYGLSENQTFIIFRIIQQLFGNIIRHSHSEHVFVELSRENNCLIMEIRDDGIGLGIDEQLDSFEIENLRSRAAVLDGELIIHSSGGQGTKIQLRVPISSETEEEIEYTQDESSVA